jgi:hypothetical protein
MAEPLIDQANCADCYYLQQRVQLQLKAGEKTDKADESPVTVADYGEPPFLHAFYL